MKKSVKNLLITIALILGLIAAVFLVAIASAELPSKSLVEALIQVESGGDDAKIGDKKLANKAYGCLQIRQCCVDDYNKSNNTTYVAKDCLNDRDLSVEICRWYIDHYATPKRLDHVPTDEDKARIWNGGPSGFKKSSTDDYWESVKLVLSN